jgi:D-threo-aldose 1-dehydrogenase
VPALKADQRVGAIGVGTNECDVAVRFVREGDIDVVLIAGRWTLLDRSAGEELLPLCADRGVQVIVGGVFNSGVLADPTGGTYAYGAVPPDVRARLDTIVAACERHDVPLPAAALQLPFRHAAVTSIVVGCRSPEEVARNAALLATPIPDELWDELGA